MICDMHPFLEPNKSCWQTRYSNKCRSILHHIAWVTDMYVDFAMSRNQLSHNWWLTLVLYLPMFQLVCLLRSNHSIYIFLFYLAKVSCLILA